MPQTLLIKPILLAAHSSIFLSFYYSFVFLSELAPNNFRLAGSRKTVPYHLIIERKDPSEQAPQADPISIKTMGPPAIAGKLSK